MIGEIKSGRFPGTAPNYVLCIDTCTCSHCTVYIHTYGEKWLWRVDMTVVDTTAGAIAVVIPWKN